ncbi:MAG TPA: radical SAM protein, partial [bacterium]|nr:radical SAM protein [bacterium]
LGLAYISAYLDAKGIGSRIIDMNVEQGDAEEQVSRIAGSPDIIGITSMTSAVLNGLEIAEKCRERFPKAKIVFGGVHATVMPEDILSRDFVDCVIRGEGEEAFYRLVTGSAPESVSGLSYRDNGVIKHNPEGFLIENLDTLPQPAYHKLPVSRYRPAVGSYKRLPAISMLATRGCPGKCTYCFGSYLGGKIRMHSVKYLIEEIKMLRSKFGIKQIMFYDDTFTTYRKKVAEFCEEVIRERIDISWVCFSRVDTIDMETLKLMKKAGCHQIMYGIESGSEEILKNINKRIDRQKATEAVRMTKKAGIECRAAFMLGNPGETEETMEKTISFAVELDPDIALFNISTPFPGTKMFEWAKANGYLASEDWMKYDLSHMLMRLPTVSAEKIEEYYKKAYSVFYNRPSYMIKRALRIRGINDIVNGVKGFFAVVLHSGRKNGGGGS